MPAKPESLHRQIARIHAANWSAAVRNVLFAPREANSRTALEDVLSDHPDLIPNGLLPLAIVDDASIAVVALRDLPGIGVQGQVLRLFTSEVADEFQLALLDVDPLAYMSSVAEELAARPIGLKRILDEIGPAYQDSYISREKRPRDYAVRPIRIACQNVIVGLAAVAQDSSFDGLTVPAWQTCEVPHVATHEGNRALAALALCDAFQNGGTMEIRFDKRTRLQAAGKKYDYAGHPEGQVPASLRRFGRTVGVLLGSETREAITPSEARALFEAITPMPADLRRRTQQAADRFGMTPERICFAILSGVWTAVELDFLLGCSDRASSILSGGASWTNRVARQAEADVSRAAVMTGMFLKRVNAMDSAAASDAGTVRVIEDRSRGVTWSVDTATATVMLSGLDDQRPMPWSEHQVGARTLILVPRCSISTALPTIEQMAGALARTDKRLAVLVPRDAPEGDLPSNVVLLRCPDRTADIDKTIEARLLTMRISRA